jgi:hypothetical protein
VAPNGKWGPPGSSTVGGLESVSNQIRDADAIRPALFDIEGAIAGYFEWKKQLYDRRGFATSTTLLALYQHADRSISGNKHGAGLIFRWQGSWDLVGRERRRRVSERSALS